MREKTHATKNGTLVFKPTKKWIIVQQFCDCDWNVLLMAWTFYFSQRTIVKNQLCFKRVGRRFLYFNKVQLTMQKGTAQKVNQSTEQNGEKNQSQSMELIKNCIWFLLFFLPWTHFDSRRRTDHVGSECRPSRGWKEERHTYFIFFLLIKSNWENDADRRPSSATMGNPATIMSSFLQLLHKLNLCKERKPDSWPTSDNAISRNVVTMTTSTTAPVLLTSFPWILFTTPRLVIYKCMSRFLDVFVWTIISQKFIKLKTLILQRDHTNQRLLTELPPQSINQSINR